jgi:hypothetical protein
MDEQYPNLCGNARKKREEFLTADIADERGCGEGISDVVLRGVR